MKLKKRKWLTYTARKSDTQWCEMQWKCNLGIISETRVGLLYIYSMSLRSSEDTVGLAVVAGDEWTPAEIGNVKFLVH